MRLSESLIGDMRNPSNCVVLLIDLREKLGTYPRGDEERTMDLFKSIEKAITPVTKAEVSIAQDIWSNQMTPLTSILKNAETATPASAGLPVLTITGLEHTVPPGLSGQPLLPGQIGGPLGPLVEPVIERQESDIASGESLIGKITPGQRSAEDNPGQKGMEVPPQPSPDSQKSAGEGMPAAQDRSENDEVMADPQPNAQAPQEEFDVDNDGKFNAIEQDDKVIEPPAADVGDKQRPGDVAQDIKPDDLVQPEEVMLNQEPLPQEPSDEAELNPQPLPPQELADV